MTSTQPSGGHALVVEHLTKRFGARVAFEDVSLTVGSAAMGAATSSRCRICRTEVDTRFGSMGSRSQHISIGIDRPVTVVYDVAADPLNLPRWAAGLAGSRVEQDGEQWSTESPMGRVRFTFAPRNDFGVLDHDVTLPSGETVYNPLRVIRDGNGCEVIFTLRQRPEMSDEEFERDADAVGQDLAALKSLVETG